MSVKYNSLNSYLSEIKYCDFMKNNQSKSPPYSVLYRFKIELAKKNINYQEKIADFDS